MISESKALEWVANLSLQFNSFYSEADAIIPQEPIEYIRNQFVTAGESLKRFYSELLEDAFSVGCLVAYGPTSPKKEEESTDLLSCEISCMSPLLNEPAGKAYEDHSSKLTVVKNPEIETSESTSENSVQCSLITECPEEIGNSEEDRFAPKVDGYKLQNNEVSRVASSAGSCSTEPTQTCERIDMGESKEPVNSDDEFRSELDCISYQKSLRKIDSRDFDDEETEAKGWEKLDKDLLCDSDWEII